MKIDYAKLKKESIVHYDRMIEWAKTKPKRRYVDRYDMINAIGESWKGEHCSYCKRFFILLCECPLRGAESGGMGCCDGLWEKMNDAKTWGKWVERAEAVREYIRDNYRPKK